MLSQKDLEQLKEVVATKEDVDSIHKELASIKKTVSRVEKTVDVMAKVLDTADVELTRRVKRIEENIGLENLN